MLMDVEATRMSILTLQEMSNNRLLTKLREEDRHRLAKYMAVLELDQGDVLQKSGDEVIYTWFPCGAATASFHLWVDDNNPGVEVALVGREGAIGGIVSNGTIASYATALVRSPGKFMRVKTKYLEQAKISSIALRHWFARYSDFFVAQAFQAAACNATHTIVQRTAKWLLLVEARTGTSEFEMTQEQLAELLGVGRTFVTRTIGRLRDEGVIETRRGVFVIRDSATLQERACDCTRMLEEHFNSVLEGIYPES